MLKKIISTLILCSTLLSSTSLVYADTINNSNINLGNGNVIQNVNIINNQNTTTITNNTATNNMAQNNIQTSTTNSTAQNGWVKEDNTHYKYYENGQALINTWKDFGEGYRHFNKNGYMDFGNSIDGIQIPQDGLYPKNDTYISSPKYLFMHLKPETYYGVSGQYAYGDLQYITNTFNVFGIKYDIQYQNTYNSNENNTILSIQNEYNNFSDDSNFDSKKIIVVGKYVQRVN